VLDEAGVAEEGAFIFGEEGEGFAMGPAEYDWQVDIKPCLRFHVRLKG